MDDFERIRGYSFLNFITVSPVSPSTARRCATLYAAHGVGDERRVLYLPRAVRCPCGRVDRSGRQGLLFRRRHARERARGICRGRRCAPFECVGGAKTNPFVAQARDCGGQRLCHRRRPRAPCGVRPDDSFGQCRFRTDRSARREF